MANDTFFDKATEASLVKANIVKKYFGGWATALKKQAMSRDGKLVYLDLFSGPGYYEEGGVKSTPLLILERIIDDPDLREIVSTNFNDAKQEYSEKLQRAVEKLPGIETLKYPPVITNLVVGQPVVTPAKWTKPSPTLLFLDPFGYKGLSLDLIWSVVKNPGSECIFFFNYRRLNTGLPNQYLNEPIDALFSPARARALRDELPSLSVDAREQKIIQHIKEALKEKGGEYVLDFRFRNDQDTRTRHFLIFVSKSPLGMKIMKDVMANESSVLGSAVPSYEFNQGKEKKVKAKKEIGQGELFFEDLDDEIDVLAKELTVVFAGRTLTAEMVYHEHNVDRPYVGRNYRDALLRLEKSGQITCNPSEHERKQNKGKPTLSKDVLITFPKGK